jgi:KamA family protein
MDIQDQERVTARATPRGDEEYLPQWRKTIAEKRKVKYITRLSDIPQLTDEEREKAQASVDYFGFRTNSYYLSLIDWDDPDDPIRRIIIPSYDEMLCTGSMDASLEHKIMVAPSTEHKYTRTALILVANVCGGICRFCFRKRIFRPDNRDISPDLGPAFNYIRSHTEVDNVLLTGGDSLILTTNKIAEILEELRKMPHVRCIRFGSKLLAFNPFRVLDDPELVKVLGQHSLPTGRIYIVTQFNHSHELTEYSREAIRKLQGAGCLLINQTPIMKGINSKPEVLAKLFNDLAQTGLPPYYAFQVRPTRGNSHFKIPFVKCIDLFEKAKSMLSGLAKRARYCGSHASGKIEVLAYDDDWLYFKYHQSKDPRYYGQFFKLPRKDDATWWDDWMENEDDSFTLDTCKHAVLGSGSM